MPADLITLMKNLGYKSDSQGICEGYAMMGIQAFLAGDYETFRNRIHHLLTHSDEVMQQITALNKKIAELPPGKKLQLNKDERRINDIKSFFEGVELFLQPYEYQEWFNAPVTQGAMDQIAPLAESKAVSAKGGMRNIISWIGIYTGQQLIEHFTYLQALVTAFKQDLAFKLEGHLHTIGLIYHSSTDRWDLIDANHPNRTSIANDSVFSSVAVAFFRKAENVTVGFQTTVIDVANNNKNFQVFRNALFTSPSFIYIHTINPLNATLKTADGVTFAHLAARAGLAPMLEKLVVEYGADLNSPTVDGVTPLAFAAAYGRIEIIRMAARLGFDLDSERGFRPMHMAIVGNLLAVVNAIMENSQLLSSPAKLLEFQKLAQKENRPEIVEYFAQLAKSVLAEANKKINFFIPRKKTKPRHTGSSVKTPPNQHPKNK